MANRYLCARRAVVFAAVLTSTAMAATRPDPRLAKAYRFQQGGWTYVHLEGSPSDLGYQHGYLLAPEIQDAFEAIRLFDTHQSQRDPGPQAASEPTHEMKHRGRGKARP